MQVGTKALARIVAAVIAVIAAFIMLLDSSVESLCLAIGAAVAASLGWYFAPPASSDLKDLVNHLTLSIPVAICLVAIDAFTVYSEGKPDLYALGALVVALFVPASVLETWLIQLAKPVQDAKKEG